MLSNFLQAFVYSVILMLGFNRADVRHYFWAIIGGLWCPIVSGLFIFFMANTAEPMNYFDPSVPVPNQIMYFLFIAGIVPIVEEILFRGVFWRVLEIAKLRIISITLITSLLFALAHGDPEHIVAVLPITFFLGWLRERSGSTLPTILCHGVNNGVVALAIIYAMLWI